MRFILFNLVVGAAVVYLISGNAGDTVRSAGFSETTASVIEDIGDKARATVAKAVEKTPNGATPAEENPKPKAVAKTHETSATAMKTPELKKTVPPLEEAKTVVSRPIHKTPPSKANPVDEAPNGQLASVSPEVDKRRAEILGKRDDGPKYAVDEAPNGQLASVSPEVDKRRAEILGKRDDGPKYAIEGGEQLMSATDRYRELSKLVDDMELVYFNSLGK